MRSPAGSISSTYDFAFRSLILLKYVGRNVGRDLAPCWEVIWGSLCRAHCSKPRETPVWWRGLLIWSHGSMDTWGLSKDLSLLNLDWFFNVLGDLLVTELCLCNMEIANGTAGIGQGEATTRVGSVVWVSPCSHLGARGAVSSKEGSSLCPRLCPSVPSMLPLTGLVVWAVLPKVWSADRQLQQHLGAC